MVTDPLEGLLRDIGDAASIHERMRVMDANLSFALGHLEELRAKHPDSWIAVYDGELVAVASTSEELAAAVEAQGFPLGRVYFEFISAQKQRWILHSV